MIQRLMQASNSICFSFFLNLAKTLKYYVENFQDKYFFIGSYLRSQYVMVKQHYHLHTSFEYRCVWEDENGLHVGNLQTYLAWYEINVRLIGPIKTTLRYKMVKQEG